MKPEPDRDLMLYYVSLGDREFALSVSQSASHEPYRVRGAAELEVQVLSRSEHGGAALVLVDGAVYRVHGGAQARASTREAGHRVIINGQALGFSLETELERRARPNRNKAASTGSRVTAPMPGRIVKVNVRAGDTVAAGAPLLGIEAMKMENELVAPSAGTVTRVTVDVGATVEADQELVVIEPG